MILWTFKLIRSVRKAIAGRKHPGQLAWGVALGALIGMIPHGNLLAVVLVLFVLMLHVNHAMAALVGVAVTFLAPRLDPTFDALGRWCFEQPQVADGFAVAWQYPLVPWTDLNNTIVMGSFLIGLIAAGPLYMITYPLFRAWAPVDVDAEVDAEEAAEESAATTQVARETNSASTTETVLAVHRIDGSHSDCDSHPVDSSDAAAVNTPPTSAASDESPAELAIDATDVRDRDVSSRQFETPPTNPQPVANAGATQSNAQSGDQSTAVPVPRPTRVAISTSVSRPVMTTETMVSTRAAQSNMAVDSYGSPVDEQHRIDEALSYLLRQLRDSKDKDAA